MSAGASSLHRAVLGALSNLVIEPAVPAWAERVALAPAPPRLSVGVVGLTPRCGATTTARALAVELALRDPWQAAVVASDRVPEGGLLVGAQSSARLARMLSGAFRSGVRATGRICLAPADTAEYAGLVETVAGLSPLVVDVADPAKAALVASLVDAVILVAAPAGEPALGRALATSLGRVGPEPLLVVNASRGGEDGWEGRCTLSLPHSRLGAQLVSVGREPRGAFGCSVSALADLVEGSS